MGGVPAIEEVRFSVAHNRGCFGACNFCSLAFHQGRIIASRSHESVLREVEALTHQDVYKRQPENTAALIFEVKGEGTRWLAQRKVGDQVNVLGPLGNGFTVEDGGRYLLVGGGIGVPPLLGYAEAFHENTVAVLGFRSADRVILADRYQEACKEVYLSLIHI